MEKNDVNSYSMNWDKLKRNAPKWFEDGKFGLFFHWGPYTVPGYQNEWYSRNMYAKGLSQNKYHVENYGDLSEFGYKDFYDKFTGEKFDAEKWVDLVEMSGARYAGVVTEHADNFSMWDSKVNPINSVNYGPKKDITAEFQKAMRKRDLNFIATFHHQWLWGWFMSTDTEADVYNPKNEKYYYKALPLETNRYMPYRLPDDEFNKMWTDKVKEVIDKYDPDLIYFDSRANIIDEKYRYDLTKYYYGKREDVIISSKQTDFPTGVTVEDIECGGHSKIYKRKWQTDDRMEAKTTWCYIQGAEYKTPKEIIFQLSDIVSKNGNLLLNIGPKVDGTFAKEAIDTIKEVGKWLDKYSEAIYGTKPFSVCGEGKLDVNEKGFDVDKIDAQIKEGTYDEDKKEIEEDIIRFTTKDNNLYAIFFSNSKNKVNITSLKNGRGIKNIRRIRLLGNENKLVWERDNESLRVVLPDNTEKEHAKVLKIEHE